MQTNKLSSQEITDLANRQVFTLENGHANGHYSLNDIGDLVPGAIIVHDIQALQTTYMNSWGCEALGHSIDEINAMGEDYYKKFFLPDEVRSFLPGMLNYFQREDHSSLYSFFHQVRTGPKMEFSWHYAVCKFLRKDKDLNKPKELIMVANPVSGMGLMANKVNKLLEENVFVTNNYKYFASLSKREKEVIALLANGKSSSDIADLLFISAHTVQTHRKNINNKLELNSFADLVHFAIAFELI
ncbi:MAG: helix-turn-helix transcriptional regulator [Daejeonella sp.]|uniref:response regulator transcription factor n=1 Tax=Daejeonella sp. TaxID=2805397 RepID=UPI003C79124F